MAENIDSLNIDAVTSEAKQNNTHLFPFRELYEGPLYLSTRTQPGIQFAVNVLSWFLKFSSQVQDVQQNKSWSTCLGLLNIEYWPVLCIMKVTVQESEFQGYLVIVAWIGLVTLSPGSLKEERLYNFAVVYKHGNHQFGNAILCQLWNLNKLLSQNAIKRLETTGMCSKNLEKLQ